MEDNKGKMQLTLLRGEEFDYHKEKPIYRQMEEWAENMPELTAVITEEASYTYRQLNQRSNQIAHRLRRIGVTNNTIIGIMTERSFDMIAGIFGIWKAGGAYLPIDVNYPLKRKQQIYQDSGIKTILAAGEEDVPASVLLLKFSDESIGEENTDNLTQSFEPSDLAYVIYTSGTTGMPKGVMIEHYALKNRIDWMQRAYPINEADVIIQKTTYSFDVSVWEIVWWATVGACVYMLQPKKESNVRTIVKMIEKHKISVIHFVPSVFKIFMDYIETDFDIERIKSLKYVFSSGESLPLAHVEHFAKIFMNREAVLINLYGPTEAAIDITYFNCPKKELPETIPIGRTIQNNYCLVMDQNFGLAKPGEEGDLYLGGTGLARGYLNNKVLTEQVFIDNPHQPGERIYKTGDIASYTEEGMILYHGRADEQIKLRGVRIELKEIEYYLSKYPGIKDSVVLVRVDSYRTQMLCAYLILKMKSDSIDIELVKEYLSEWLPAYMIPSRFIIVSEIPLKVNGKADKKKLMEIYD